MALSATKIDQVWKAFLRIALPIRGACIWNKDVLRAVTPAVDTWHGDNAASFNSALPQPFRGNATADEKLAMNALVSLARMSSEMRNSFIAAVSAEGVDE